MTPGEKSDAFFGEGGKREKISINFSTFRRVCKDILGQPVQVAEKGASHSQPYKSEENKLTGSAHRKIVNKFPQDRECNGEFVFS